MVCIKLLNGFNNKELKNLEKFAACSYINSDKVVLKLLVFLNKKILKRQQFIEKRNLLLAYNAVFSENLKEQDFLNEHKKKLNDKFNKLTRLAEKFLVFESLDSESYQYNSLLLERLKQMKLFDLQKKLINKNEKILKHKIAKNINFYQHNLIVEQTKLAYYYKNEALKDTKIIQRINYNLDLHYALQKLSIYSTSLSLIEFPDNIFKKSELNTIATLIEAPKYSVHPQIKLFKAAIELLTNQQEKKFNKFVDKIKDYATVLSQKDLLGFYSIASNYLVRQMKKGKFRYNYFLHLYKEIERQNLLIENKRIPIAKLKNIIIVACNQAEHCWAENILNKYIYFVEKQIQKSVYNLNMGIICFYKKNFKETLSYLIKTEQVDLVYDKACRLLTLKCHYELDKEYDERSIRIFRSAEQYFKNIKPSNTTDRIGYRNFFKTFINLYRVKHGVGKTSLNVIKDKLELQDYNRDKSWLLSKIYELEH